MKKITITFLVFPFLIFLIHSEKIQAQAPDWNWATRAGGFNLADDKGQSVMTDQSGNVYVTGYYYSPTIMFDSIQLVNTSVNFKADIFLAKYDPSGNLLWAKTAGGTDDDLSLSCTVDPVGNVIIAGYYKSPVLTIGGFQLNNFGGYDDIFIARFNSSGSVLWAKSYGAPFNDFAMSVSCDSTGYAYVAGYFESYYLPLDSDTLYNTGGLDFYVARFAISNGAISWVRSATGTDDDFAYSVSADAGGNAYVGGHFSSPILDFGNTYLSNQGASDIFVCKYDMSGSFQWVTMVGGTNTDICRSIATDYSGNIYLTGQFAGSLSFLNTTLTASANDFLLFSLDNSGNGRWATSGGGIYVEEGTSVCTDFFGNVYTSGTFASPSITIGNTTLSNPGSILRDSYIAAYDNNGNNLWAKSINGPDVEVANSVWNDGLGNLYTTGFFGSNSISLDGIILNNIGAAPYQDVFTAKLSTEVGISENNNYGKEISIYPNPVKNQLTVDSKQYTIKKVEVEDLIGRKVLSLQHGIASQKIQLDVTKLPADIYFVRIETDKKIFVEKLVKQ